jgi:hypothetical protein
VSISRTTRSIIWIAPTRCNARAIFLFSIKPKNTLYYLGEQSSNSHCWSVNFHLPVVYRACFLLFSLIPELRSPWLPYALLEKKHCSSSTRCLSFSLNLLTGACQLNSYAPALDSLLCALHIFEKMSQPHWSQHLAIQDGNTKWYTLGSGTHWW